MNEESVSSYQNNENENLQKSEIDTLLFKPASNNESCEISSIKKKNDRYATVIVLLVIVVFYFIYSNTLNDQSISATKEIQSKVCNTSPVEHLRPLSEITGIENGAVATDDKICSEMSLEILKKGGNAVDAAVTAALCVGIVNPASSGIGGGAFILVHIKNKPNGTEVIDAREVAPKKATRDMYKGNATASTDGGLAIAIPGELRGLELAHQRHGALPWANLVEPVIKLAEDGVPVSLLLTRYFYLTDNRQLKFPNLAKVFSKNNDGTSVLRQGDIIKRPELAKTLRQIMHRGADAFYHGDIAKHLVKEINEQGGIFELSDLVNYKPIVRKPLIANEGNGYTIVGAPPPSSGGATLIGISRFLSGYKTPFAAFPDTLSLHRLLEASKHAFSIRMSMSDPAFHPDENKAAVEDLISGTYMEQLRQQTLDNSVLPLSAYGGPKWSQFNENDPSKNNRHRRTKTAAKGFNYLNDHGTSHVSIIDKDRNAVVLTSTINIPFGSGVYSQSTGVILNNDMDDFASPNVTNEFGVPPSEANYIYPGKRPLSSMSPTLIFFSDGNTNASTIQEYSLGKLFMALGASGGPKIITAVLLTFIHHALQGKSLFDAVAQPRIHHQLLYEGTSEALYDQCILDIDTSVTIELNNISKAALTKRHQLLQPDHYLGTVEAISVDLETDTLTAVSDLRKMGFPAGY